MKTALLVTALLAGSASADPLKVEVFTGSPQGFLVDSTIVSGAHDAILIDAQFDRADAHRLVAQLIESKKTLTTVYITHAHPDHYFGLEVVHQAFPKAKLVALPATVAEIAKTWRPKVAQWQPLYGDNLTSTPVLPVAMTGTTLSLEGQTLEVHGGAQGDSSSNSYVWIPSISTVVAGDIVYRGVHVWTADTNAAARAAWAKSLDTLAALHPVAVIPGHKDPKLDNAPASLAETKSYLAAFDAALASSKSAPDLEAKVKAKYPALALDVILHFGALAQFPAAK
ncbi:MAG TPA: MBL fold metallo-hydrolase [Kofleriaceae bacterium]|jgi:glyoxylase-like metal-dependent hydrolase (beta-lactamase superfamily II)